MRACRTTGVFGAGHTRLTAAPGRPEWRRSDPEARPRGVDQGSKGKDRALISSGRTTLVAGPGHRPVEQGLSSSRCRARAGRPAPRQPGGGRLQRCVRRLEVPGDPIGRIVSEPAGPPGAAGHRSGTSRRAGPPGDTVHRARRYRRSERNGGRHPRKASPRRGTGAGGIGAGPDRSRDASAAT